MKYYLLIPILLIQIKISYAVGWNFETIHDPIYFNLTNKTLVLDDNNVPHIFYGESHLYHSYLANNVWVSETIDTEPYSGKYATAVTDSDGKFHVIYQVKQSIKYATNKNGAWKIATIPHSYDGFLSEVGVGDLTVDLNGNVHIAFESNKNLYYINNSTPSWPIAILDENCCLSKRGRINILTDRNNFIHIFYNADYERAIRYANNVNNIWLLEHIDTDFFTDYNSAVIDKDGFIHIALNDGAELYYLSNTSGNWLFEPLVQLNYNDNYPIESVSIAVDNNNKAHIAHTSCDSYCARHNEFYLMYANNTSDSWVTEKLLTGELYTNTSIIIDPDENVHISFAERNGRNLVYMSNKTMNWDSTNVTTSDKYYTTSTLEKVGLESSILEDSNGNLHVAYRAGDKNYGRLIYATNASGSWANTLSNGIYANGVVDKFSLALDSNNNPYILYAKSQSIGIFYLESGQWKDQDIELKYPARNTELSLAIDNSGVIHALYFLRNGQYLDNMQLRYAKLVNGSWSFETLYETGENFSNNSDYTNSLYLDDTGSAHIGYIDKSGDLYYISNETGSWKNKYIVSSTDEHTWLQKDYIVLPGGIVHMAYSSMRCKNIFCYNTGIEYLTNSNGFIEYETVDIDLYDYYGIVQSFPMTSPSLARNVNGDISISYTHVYYPDPSNLWIRDHKIYNSRKTGQLWRISPIEQNVFSTSGTAFDIFSGLDFSNNIIDSHGNISISYFNGTSGTLELYRSYQQNEPLINVQSNIHDLDFGSTTLGEIKKAEIKIENLGNELLFVNDISLVSDDHSAFVMNLEEGENSCNILAFSLISGESCTLTISFIPNDTDEKQAILLIESNDNEIPLLVGELTGVGILNTKTKLLKTGNINGGGGILSYYLLLALLVLCQYSNIRKRT